MKNAAIVTAWNDTFFSGDEAKASEYIADDFVFIGPAPEPLNKAAYNGMMHTLKKGFPDLNNDLKISGESGDEVKGSVQMQGTHTEDFDLSGMGMQLIPPTGRSFRLPRENFTITVKDGKITRFEVAVPEGGGLMGILKQLGIKPPA